MYYYCTNFKPKNEEAKKAVQEMRSALDYRKAGLKGASEDQLQRILAGFIAQGAKPFEVVLKHVPEEDKAAVTSATECLVRSGYIQRTKGKQGYKKSESWDIGFCQFQTPEGKGPHRVNTRTQITITDESYKLRPLEDLKLLQSKKATFLGVPKAETQVNIFSGWVEAPSRRWWDLEGYEDKPFASAVAWEDFSDLVQNEGYKRGKLPFLDCEHNGQKGWLVNDVERAVRAIAYVTHKNLGPRGNPLMVTHETEFGRSFVIPGLIEK